MVDDLEAIAVVASGQIRFRHRHAHAVAKSLTERSGCHFDTRRQATLRVARRDAAPLPELPKLFERQIISCEVEKAV